MTISRITKHPADPDLVCATLKFTGGLFQSVVGLTRGQIEFLERRKDDEEEVKEILCGRPVLLPSLRVS